MRTPSDTEVEELMRRHGDYVETSQTHGRIYAFDRIGIENMFDEWIDRQSPVQLPPPSLSRKRQIAALAADSEGGDLD